MYTIFKDPIVDLEPDQLNPIWNESKNGETSADEKKIEKIAEDIPEQVSAELRLSAMEAVTEAIVDDMIEEEDADLTKAEEEVDTIVDKAADLHLVSSSIKTRVREMMAKKHRQADPRTRLLRRAAEIMTENFVTMCEEEPVVDQVLDTEPADIVDANDNVVEPSGDSENNTGSVPTVATQRYRRMEADEAVVDEALDTEPADTGFNTETETVVPSGDSENTEGTVPTQRLRRRKLMKFDSHGRLMEMEDLPEDKPVVEESVDMSPMEDTGFDVTTETIEPSGDSENTEGSTPTVEMRAAMRLLADSERLRNKALKVLTKKFAGYQVKKMLHDLRHHLPENFKRKYQIQ